MPASWPARMTCSSSGLPRKRTSGLGSSPLRAASLVPIPAARIRAVLVLDITSLHDLVTLRWFVRWPVIEIADGNVGGAEDHHFRDAGGIRGKPEGAVLVVLLDEVNTMRPEGWLFGRLTVDAGDRIIFGINPYAPAKQILVGAFRNCVDYVCGTTHNGFGADKLKVVVLRDDPRFGASCRARTLRFRFQHLAQHVLVSALPSFFGDHLEVLCAIGIARDRHGQDGAFV